MGFYAPSQLIRDAREHGVSVRPVDANFSEWDCTLENEPAQEGASLRLGFRSVKGFAQRHADQIVAARQSGVFISFQDFMRRTQFSRAVAQRLAEADAFASLANDRRAALWQVLAQDKQPQDRPLLLGQDDEESPTELPPLSLREQVLADYRTGGHSLKAHPLSFFRRQLGELRVSPAAALKEIQPNRLVQVAGLVILRQRPSTARGITFVTLEDETGVVNLIVRQAIWERYYSIARTSSAWIAQGKLERKEAVIHVVVNRLQDLAATIGDWSVPSRDFR
jgi:error-prone DNA polymerase